MHILTQLSKNLHEFMKAKKFIIVDIHLKNAYQTYALYEIPYKKGSGSAYHTSIENPKNKKHFGHTFTRHRAGKKNTNALRGRAASTGKNQGQWTDDKAAASFLNSLLPVTHPIVVPIPPGLGIIIHPDGSISPASYAIIVPKSGGGFRTAYPVDNEK